MIFHARKLEANKSKPVAEISKHRVLFLWVEFKQTLGQMFKADMASL